MEDGVHYFANRLLIDRTSHIMPVLCSFTFEIQLSSFAPGLQSHHMMEVSLTIGDLLPNLASFAQERELEIMALY